MPTWEALHTQDNGVGAPEQEAPHGPEIIEARSATRVIQSRLC